MKTIKYIILIGLAIYVVVNVSNITDALANYLSGENKIIIPEKNEFYKNYSYNYVKENETFIPYSKQDLINIYYSILNNGYDNFTYYCPKEYTNCLKDTADITVSVGTGIGTVNEETNDSYEVKPGEHTLKVTPATGNYVDYIVVTVKDAETEDRRRALSNSDSSQSSASGNKP